MGCVPWLLEERKRSLFVLTIFCTAKAFCGDFNVIQRNAIRSWTLLEPKPEILLFGNEKGYAEVAKDFGLRHIHNAQINEYGTPLLSSLFAESQRLASNSLLCYLDADIILMRDFMLAVKEISDQTSRFLMVGESWSVEVKWPLKFERHDWSKRLKENVHQSGKTHGSFWGMDYFVFPRSLFGEIPPFAVGRPGWDNWLVYHARSLHVPVVDATGMITSVHQQHDFSHHRGGYEFLWKGPEALANQKLVGGNHYLFSVKDATHVLTKEGLRRALAIPYLWRRLYTAPVLYPRIAFLRTILDALLRITRPIRIKLDLIFSRYSR